MPDMQGPVSSMSIGVNDHKVEHKYGDNGQMTWMIPGLTDMRCTMDPGNMRSAALWLMVPVLNVNGVSSRRSGWSSPQGRRPRAHVGILQS